MLGDRPGSFSWDVDPPIPLKMYPARAARYDMHTYTTPPYGFLMAAPGAIAVCRVGEER